MVAFMGGTGVGKSSLLNRLAGKPVAKTGVERPTSLEVTLYHHREITIQHLPEKLPLSSAKVAQHDDDSKKNIIWIDMPDFDSIERKNKELVLAWLPHIDVLIYVVSPERYRDDKAWRLLLAEGGRHAWLFAFNQWDKGYSEQFQDFQQQLQKAGFVEPIIFKTSCTNLGDPDEFNTLQAAINSLATEHTIKHLEQRNLELKKKELQQVLQRCAQVMGGDQCYQQIISAWHHQWAKTKNLLLQGFIWPIRQLAGYYAEHAADLIANTSNNSHSLWDDWAQTRFDDALDEFISHANDLNIPVSPLRKQFLPFRDKAPKIIQKNNELAVRQSLANPGNLLQRGFLKFVRFCEIVLPLASICWVGYQVFIGYYSSSITNDHYLGVDFAVHSGLLIAISWLAPFFLLKKLKPSLEKSALTGLNKGLNHAFDEIELLVTEAIKLTDEQHTAQRRQISEIIKQCSQTEPNVTLNAQNPLTRMLVDEQRIPKDTIELSKNKNLDPLQ